MSPTVLPPRTAPDAEPGQGAASGAPTAPPVAPAPPGPSWVPPQPPPVPGGPVTAAPHAPGGGRPPLPPRRPARVPRFAHPTRLIALLVVVVAIVFDLAAHQSLASLGVTLFVGVAVVALVASGRVRRVPSLALGVGSAAMAVLLSVRVSLWLVVPVALAAAALLVLSATYANGGSALAVTGSSLARRGGRFAVSVVLAPAYAFACVASCIPARSERRRAHLVSVARGIGMALPVVVVLALLLASADAVFASLFVVPVDLGSVPLHLALFGIGVIVASSLFAEASSPAVEDRAVLGTPIGPTESIIVLASVALLYLAFAAVQVITSRGGADHVIETAGLTYAGHAREGFFQLLAVAVLTLGVVCGLRATMRLGSRAQRVAVTALCETVVALTLVIVGVAIERLALYEAEFGATMLRLACTAFAWWLGAVFLLVVLASAGLGRTRTWLTGAVVVSALVALVAWSVVNPERVVVERNVALAQADERDLDVGYLWHLSDDAVPAMAAALPGLEGTDRDALLERICTRRHVEHDVDERRIGPSGRSEVLHRSGVVVHTPGPGAPGGPEPLAGLGANRSASLAAAARAEVCPG